MAEFSIKVKILFAMSLSDLFTYAGVLYNKL